MSGNVELAIILIPILLASMAIHEMVHAYVSDWLGDDTARIMGRVSLNPFKHMDPFLTFALPVLLVLSGSPFLYGAAKPVPVNFYRLRYNEFGGAIVGMSGPLTNLLIAIIAGFLFKVINPIYGTLGYLVIEMTILLNTSLFIFNSIPWPPLDGSRLLYAFAPERLQEAMNSLERMGLTSVVILIFALYTFGQPLTTINLRLIDLIAPGLIF